MRRRPFLLLEVIIAIVLVGLFASVSLGALLRAVQRQSGMVQSLQKMRQIDLERMHLIEEYWNRLEELKERPIKVTGASKAVFEVSCQGNEKAYLLVIREVGSKRIPHYFLCNQ